MDTNNNPRAVVMNQKTKEGIAQMFSSPPAVTAVCAFSLLTFFTLIRIIVTTASSKMSSAFVFLYYFGGSNSVPVVNCIVGLLVFSFLAFMDIALLYTFFAARNSKNNKITKGLNLMKASLIYILILSIICIFISLCSVSVMYQASVIANEYGTDSSDAVFAHINGISSQTLFASTCFFGTLIICIIIGFISFSNSVINAADGTAYKTGGSVFSLIISIIAGISFFFGFFGCLRNLIMPADVGPSISFTYVGTAGCDVIINASLCTFFTALAFLSSGYRGVLNRAGKFASSVFFYSNGYQNSSYVNTSAAPSSDPNIEIHPEPMPSEKK